MYRIAACLFVALAAAAPASAQPGADPAPPPASSVWDPAVRLASQREAMQALAFLDGAWRGGAEMEGAPSGMTQTERVGTLLGGSVRLVEGRGYDSSGATVFNALGIISYDPARRAYSMRSYAMGFAGDYPLSVRPDGFSWSHPMGPGVSMRYTAAVTGDEWVEVGERVADGAAPVRVFEMRLRRIGPADWPQAGAVAAR